jgi:uncharacterized membrane protein YqjE
MDQGKPAPAGYIDSLRTLADEALASVQRRIELFTVELQEEKFRVIQTFIWICAAIFSGMLAIAFISLLLVYLTWESGRLAVLGGLALFYTVACAAIVVACRRHLARQPHPFAATVQELEEDRACIQAKS